MSTRAIIGGALLLSLTATMGFVACHGTQPGSVPQPMAQPTSTSVVATSTTPPPPVAPTSTPAPVDTVAIAVSAARACTAPSSEIANTPDGGLVFVNAWRRQDAGNIDRLQGVVDAIVEHDTAFRCCFDVWTAAHPGEKGKLMLSMELEPEGAVKSARVDTSRSNVDDEVTKRCVLDVARSVTYPASPSKRSTLVEFPFVIGPR